MAPTRPKSKPNKRKHQRTPASTAAAKPNARQLLAEATRKLEQGSPSEAVRLARSALDAAGPSSDPAHSVELAALQLLGESHLELGEAREARAVLERAAERDPEGRWEGVAVPGTATVGGEGAGADKFLYLAQICEAEMAALEEPGEDDDDEMVVGEGSAARAKADECLRWYERGTDALRRRLQELSSAPPSTSEKKPRRTEDREQQALQLVRRKLATALCAQAEAWMSTLALNCRPEAEARCEALVSEATLLAPTLAEPWATLASVRISQSRIPDARAALKRYLAIVVPAGEDDEEDEQDEEEEALPPYPSRVAATRLLLEVGLRRDALAVLERLLGEEDGVIEVWYLGGWALYLLGSGDEEDAGKDGEAEVEATEERRTRAWREARRWLRQCLELFAVQEYDDEAMREHAEELLAAIVAKVGNEGTDEDDEWEDEDEGSGSDDKEMKGS